MRKRILLLVALLALMFGGCVVGTDESGQKTYGVDPNIAKKVEGQVEGGIAILSVLVALLWPAGGAVVGYLGHALQTWKLVKPKLVKAQSEAEMYHTAALTTAIGLDEFKKAYPNDWKKVSAELVNIKDRLISPEDRQKIENVILGLRGLPPKA